MGENGTVACACERERDIGAMAVKMNR